MSPPRSRARSIAANPLLLGAVGIFILCSAIGVAVVATHRLPFVPTYHLRVQVPDAAEVARGADVTIAGTRVGQVSKVTAEPQPGARATATLALALDADQGPLPADSSFRIRISGSLGRKSVAITPGASTQTLPSGTTVPLTQADAPVVDLDQILNTFRPPVREGSAEALQALGTGFAGRGQGLNRALGELPAMLADLTPVMRTLAAPSTHLQRAVGALSDLAHALAPAAGPLAGLQDGLDRTFGALAATAPALGSAIAKTPQTLSVATASLRRARPFLRATTAFARDLEPATARLPATAPILADALAAGADELPRVPGLDARLTSSTDALGAFAADPVVRSGTVRLTETASALRVPLAFLTPAETTCSYFTLLLRNLASMTSEGYASGKAVRATGVVVGVSPNSERGPSSRIYAGKPAKALGPVNSNPYPDTSAPGQSPLQCAAGHEPYVASRPVVGNPPAVLPDKTEATTLP